jgi:hypothetical protein
LFWDALFWEHPFSNLPKRSASAAIYRDQLLSVQSTAAWAALGHGRTSRLQNLITSAH